MIVIKYQEFIVLYWLKCISVITFVSNIRNNALLDCYLTVLTYCYLCPVNSLVIVHISFLLFWYIFRNRVVIISRCIVVDLCKCNISSCIIGNRLTVCIFACQCICICIICSCKGEAKCSGCWCQLTIYIFLPCKWCGYFDSVIEYNRLNIFCCCLSVCTNYKFLVLRCCCC